MSKTSFFYQMSTFKNILFLLLICILTQGCSTGGYSVEAYKSIGGELKRNYKLSRGDLIVAYDLGRIDKTNCIYSADLGNIINDRRYKSKYISRFKALYKSPLNLKKEAMRKIVRINKLLLELHHNYRILSNSKYQYVRRLSRSDLTQVDLRKELDVLDRIISFIPIMIPIGSTTVTSKYGNRLHPIKKREVFHCGLDMVAKNGANVYASANGIVVFAGKKAGYGNVVEIQHSKTLKTLYAHLAKISVKKGRSVARGKAVGVQGSTGATTGDHLHFEVWVNDRHVNPYDFVSSECTCR
ncbi:MAG: M23 family metallopeptidase [Rickettsiaceae bacterium]|uniref:M23 family metallopeptidase n=1 Tax=Candidatus Megaera venefica TaxID=2055910 RepID=UPI002AD4D356|nr:M23 family metallopeptidase [Candidatus Megaera venefica]MBY0533972.1 M23 family metallopeptidase [Rickettsiaceae bacterium]